MSLSHHIFLVEFQSTMFNLFFSCMFVHPDPQGNDDCSTVLKSLCEF